MASSVPLQIAETIQTASIKRHPDILHDVNPSTSASQKTPVTVSHHNAEAGTSPGFDAYDEVDDIDDVEDEDDIPYDVIRPVQRRKSLPPLPDLRFEQSYLASIAGADSVWKVLYITTRDQILFPLIQGTLWSLGLHGWRYWNRNTQLSGNNVGARIRRWWWKTNNWEIREKVKVDLEDPKLAEQMEEFYQNLQGASD